ncbi:hypothetical protein TNCV_4205101 [Trichonephila clavipes]|nr:hypothetical protein TNCV_4205101 [Trichonephila clavipes]
MQLCDILVVSDDETAVLRNRVRIPEKASVQHGGTLNVRRTVILAILEAFAKQLLQKSFLRCLCLSIDSQCAISASDKQENFYYCGIAGSATNCAIK